MDATKLAVGTKGSLTLDIVAAPLPCTVVDSDGTMIRLKFDLNPQASSALRQALDRLEVANAA
jgi:hypothetical protein